MTLDDCLKKFMEFEGIAVGSDMEECLRWILTLDISFEYAAPLDELSLQYWDIDDEFDGDDSYLAVENGGYSAVVNKYAESVQEFVRLRSKVKAIEYGNDAVITILCSSTDTGEEFSLVSKNIIVTLPLGVLQAGSVQFKPELPEAKANAIKSLGSGLVNKIVLHWEMDESDIFWPQKKEWINILHGEQSASSSPFLVSEFFNPGSIDSSQRMLIGFVISTQAAEMEKLSDEETANAALDTLRRIFGDGKVPPPKKVLVTRWGSDEFSLGSYSFQRIGSSRNSRADLARPIGNRIFFAGEATDRSHPATTHGALMSGEKAGRAVASKLSEKSDGGIWKSKCPLRHSGTHSSHVRISISTDTESSTD
jgi:lysine-specific histone demethylase 1